MDETFEKPLLELAPQLKSFRFRTEDDTSNPLLATFIKAATSLRLFHLDSGHDDLSLLVDSLKHQLQNLQLANYYYCSEVLSRLKQYSPPAGVGFKRLVLFGDKPSEDDAAQELDEWCRAHAIQLSVCGHGYMPDDVLNWDAAELLRGQSSTPSSSTRKLMNCTADDTGEYDSEE